MITVAVAARDSSANKYYRGLLAEAKYEAIYAPDVDSLIRCVKSRPVDLVLFDLTPPSVPVTEWLEAAAKDGDRALTPVLWIGDASPSALATTLDSYRPGACIPQKPTLTKLSELVHQMVGRVGQANQPATDQEKTSQSEWKPEGETIDDALSIFAESGGSSGLAASSPDVEERAEDKDIEQDEDWQTSEICRSGPVGHSSVPSSPLDDAMHAGPDYKEAHSLADFDGESAKSATSDPVSEFSASATRNNSPTVASEKSATCLATPVTEEFIDEITSRVVNRLAVEIFKNLDTNAIRQIVKDVLANTAR